MAALFFSRSHRLRYPIARDPGAVHLGRHLPRPKQSVHKKPAPRSRSVPTLSLSRFILGSLPAGPESFLHVRLLFLEHGPDWFSSQQHSPAIDYISGRADSLAFVLSAGAWLLVLRARIAKARWLKGITYLLAALSGVLALCSREIACIWILIFLVHTLAFARDIGKKAKITTILCCALVLGTYAELRRLPAARAEPGFTEHWSAPG